MTDDEYNEMKARVTRQDVTGSVACRLYMSLNVFKISKITAIFSSGNQLGLSSSSIVGIPSHDYNDALALPKSHGR